MWHTEKAAPRLDTPGGKLLCLRKSAPSCRSRSRPEEVEVEVEVEGSSQDCKSTGHGHHRPSFLIIRPFPRLKPFHPRIARSCFRVQQQQPYRRLQIEKGSSLSSSVRVVSLLTLPLCISSAHHDPHHFDACKPDSVYASIDQLQWQQLPSILSTGSEEATALDERPRSRRLGWMRSTRMLMDQGGSRLSRVCCWRVDLT